MSRLFAIIFLFVLFLGLGLFVYFTGQQTRLGGKATVSGTYSPENSYLFASPLLAVANNQERIRVTVFVLDSQGVGVSGKTVFLGKTANLVTASIQPTTDSLGKAVFDISTNVPAEYVIQVDVEGQVLPQTVKVNFRP